MLVRVPVADGSPDFVEVDVEHLTASGVALVAGGSDIGQASYTLAASMERVMPAVSAILARLRSAGDGPDEIGMTFGLSVGGETGLVFAKGTAGATFAVKVTWRKPGRADAA